MVTLAGVFKWVILICIIYIGVMAFMSSNSIIQQTSPIPDNSLLGNQTKQTNAFIDLGASLAPGILLLIAGWVIVKALGGAD